MNQIQIKKKRSLLFKKNETFYHKCAVETLALWVKGIIEQPFCVDGKIVFVPDVACYKNGILDCIYEVVHKHPLTGHKYGLIQYYCYRSIKELTVFEISADFILSQKSKPDRIETMECYTVSPFECDEISDFLINPIK
jgi:hypothetical protein